MESAVATAAVAPIFERMCRACMGKEHNFHSIREIGVETLKIYEMLNITAPLLFIQAEDQLPELICSVCLDKLHIAYHFQEKCIATDRQLRAELHSRQTKDTTAAEPPPANDIEEAAVQTKGTTAAEPSPANDMEETDLKPDPLLDNEEFILLECLKIEIDEEHTDQNQANFNSDLQAEHKNAGSASKVLPARQDSQRQASDVEGSHSDERPNKRGNFPCPDCDEIFDRSYRLRCHAEVHSAERPFQCETCKYRFETENQLAMHKISHNSSTKAEKQTETHTEEENVFLCPQCGKAFQNNSNMRQHLLRHTGERRYQCPECPSRFACLSGLTKHMSIHRTVKPHVCDICSSRFSSTDELTKHKRYHTGERPHKCEQCNMTFVLKGTLRRHMRTHTGEKPYKCEFCDRAYAQSGDLAKHLRSHVGKNIYSCTQCPVKFKYLSELRKHTAKHYKEQQQRHEE